MILSVWMCVCVQGKPAWILKYVTSLYVPNISLACYYAYRIKHGSSQYPHQYTVWINHGMIWLVAVMFTTPWLLKCFNGYVWNTYYRSNFSSITNVWQWKCYQMNTRSLRCWFKNTIWMSRKYGAMYSAQKEHTHSQSVVRWHIPVYRQPFSSSQWAIISWNRPNGIGVISICLDETWQYAANYDGSCFGLITGHCVIITIWRKGFSQWERSFYWNLRCHWLKFLRQRQNPVVIQGPGTRIIIAMRYDAVAKALANGSAAFIKSAYHWVWHVRECPWFDLVKYLLLVITGVQHRYTCLGWIADGIWETRYWFGYTNIGKTHY